MGPPQAHCRRQGAVLERHAADRKQVEVQDEQQHREPNPRQAAAAGPQPADGYRQDGQHQAHNGQRHSPLQLRPPVRLGRTDQLVRGRGIKIRDHVPERWQLHGDGVLGELHDPELDGAGHPLDALPVVQRDREVLAIGRYGMPRPLRRSDLHPPIPLTFHEDVGEGAVGQGVLGIDHGAATAEAAEAPRCHRRELPGMHRLAAQGQHACHRGGADLQRQPCQQAAHHYPHADHRHVMRAMPTPQASAAVISLS